MHHSIFPQLGYGIGLRAPHYDILLSERPKDIDWLEIISENFMETHRGYWEFLSDLRRDYNFVMHGVSLSIGSTDPLNMEYLQKLKALIEHLNPAWVSDHLCWTGINGHNTHDLLPLPYTKQALEHISTRIEKVQDYLGRPLILENPSTYVSFAASHIPEWEFLAALTEKTQCGLLLDINNVYVSAYNHDFSPIEYIDTIPRDRIAQIHLAGHRNLGTHIIDTHDAPVIDPVWKLYEHTIKTKGTISTMIEWDDNIPTFSVLTAELNLARQHAELAHQGAVA